MIDDVSDIAFYPAAIQKEKSTAWKGTSQNMTSLFLIREFVSIFVDGFR